MMCEEVSRRDGVCIKLINYFSMRLIALILSLSAIVNVCKSQSIDSLLVNKMKNKEPLRYIGKKGRWISEKPMEAFLPQVVFYSFFLDTVRKELKISGAVLDPGTGVDSDGIVNYIFLATPSKNKLTKIRTLGESYHRSKGDPHPNIFPFRNGDFALEFRFDEKERLYFNGEITFPIEYNVGALLKDR